MTIDNTALLIRATLRGDTNLDRAVNLSDFANLTAGFNQPGTWINGDFNYDGQVGLSDFADLTANFNVALPIIVPSGTITTGIGSDPALQSGASVPEPATCAGVAASAALVLRARRRP